jgi:hypothetical protein
LENFNFRTSDRTSKDYHGAKAAIRQKSSFKSGVLTVRQEAERNESQAQRQREPKPRIGVE